MTDKMTETWVTAPLHKLGGGQLAACLVHIYPSGPSMGRRYALGAESWILGRGDGCDICVPENSVSRRHARIDPTTAGYAVRDLDSTNGTYVNDVTTCGPHLLRDGDYVRVGNCIYRFLAGGNIESEYHEEIYRLTIIDGLTQLHNYRYFLDFLDRELARSVRHARPLSVLLIDLDHFKVVNDTYGHLCGDHVLRELADRLRPQVRREDLFARYGGEEFAVVLVETPAAEAAAAGERVRHAVAAGPFAFDGREIAVTVSVGVATTQGDEPALTPAGLLQVADARLYAAKHDGRNAVRA